jgi:hypothetical protein
MGMGKAAAQESLGILCGAEAVQHQKGGHKACLPWGVEIEEAFGDVEEQKCW